MLHIVAIVTTQPGQREAVLNIVRENLATTRAEAGCIEYQPVTDAADFGPFQAPLGPDTFVVLEKWESKEALMAHATAPHMIDYGRKTKGMLASRSIHILSAI
jgi:quinol monooxygenase YgiN